MTRARRSRAAAAARPGSPRPAHLRPKLVALVAVGGAIGTAIREGVALVVPHPGPFPIHTFAINITGAFVLGVLLELLARRGPDVGRRRAARLFVGTGILGGYTTYSTFAVETAALVRADDWPWAVAYALGTVVIGGLASLAGIALAARFGRRDPDDGAR